MTEKEIITILRLHSRGLTPLEMTRYIGGYTVSALHYFLNRQNIKPNRNPERCLTTSGIGCKPR